MIIKSRIKSSRKEGTVSIGIVDTGYWYKNIAFKVQYACERATSQMIDSQSLVIIFCIEFYFKKLVLSRYLNIKIILVCVSSVHQGIYNPLKILFLRKKTSKKSLENYEILILKSFFLKQLNIVSE